MNAGIPYRPRRAEGGLLPTPPDRAAGRVFDQDAGGREFVADAIGLREVARLSRLLARVDQRVDLGAALLLLLRFDAERAAQIDERADERCCFVDLVVVELGVGLSD